MKFALILIVSLTAVGAEQPLCLITAPNVVHLDVDETVTVQLDGATTDVAVKLHFEDELSKKQLSNMETVLLNRDNDYQATVKLKVHLSNYQNLKKNFYVQLVAESSIFTKIRKANIILSSRKGYIFIQTDKPIYNPGDNVHFRVFTLDQYLLPVDEAIKVRILNSKGLMIYNNAVRSRQIYEHRIGIPDVEQAGHWKIIAWFAHYPMSNSSVEFEVKEYVLPSFEVTIKALKPYYLLKDPALKFSVSARYTYGKGLQGLAYIRFALVDEQGNRTYLPGLEMQNKILDGNTEITLHTEELRHKAEMQSITNIEGYHLYIAVSALETATGELEEAESLVKIVSTPYLIDLSKTKQYFVPEGEFSILATTTYPDGTVVPNPKMRATVDVTGVTDEPINLEAAGNEDGEAQLTFKVPKQAKSLNIKVFAEGEREKALLSDAQMTAKVMTSPSSSYLSVEVPHVTLRRGQDITVVFRDITDFNRPTHIYYMILNKGKVVQLRKVQRTELTTVRLAFSNDLVPSFRIVAYYYIKQRGNWMMVADSVWVDAQDVCEGQIEILPFKRNYKPSEILDVMVQTDRADKVALAAVDTAVYILNKQDKLTSRKMFHYMNSYDLACSVGGGKDHLSVLLDAGLTFISEILPERSMRRDFGCPAGETRQKRSTEYSRLVVDLVNSYKARAEKLCCNNGVKIHPLRHSCETRHAHTAHQSPECRRAFLRCCNEAKKKRDELRKSKRRHSIARTDSSVQEEVDYNNLNIYLRSFFPQTWMWMTKDVDATGVLRHSISVPDSITTWEVQAISMSKVKGFCIAEPRPLTVFQDFFVSLKLPYSVKRNEQLEMKAVLYNYREEPLEVTVWMASVEGLCSAGSERDMQAVTVPGNSAVSVYFVMVPLIIGNIPIQVSAFTSDGVGDMIKKDLKVVGEGDLVSQQYEYNLDVKGAKQLDIEIPAPPSSIPGEERETYVSIKGGTMGESAGNCLNLEGVNRLIQLPTGCAEQTMVKMSPAIHAIKYLDATNLWVNLGAERRDEARGMIQSGYQRILSFKKDDGSYGAFQRTPSSVWLTAFIAKELIRCRSLINVEHSYVLESISYLVSKQLENGAFKDPNPVYDRNMQGGVGGFEGDVSLTSFVLVTLHNSLPIYTTVQGAESTVTRMAMIKAERYLSEKLDSLQRPFAVAITAYALMLSNPQSAAAERAQSKLRSMAACADNMCHWNASEELRLSGERRAGGVPQADSISIETTAYALLQTLLGDDAQYATRIARWLTKQRQYGGGFRSTQDTVVALEALSVYSTESNDVQQLDMNVEFCFPSGKKKVVHLASSNALTAPAFQVEPGNAIQVNLRGKGRGTLSVVQTFRTMEGISSYCDFYHLNVTLERDLQYQNNEEYDSLDDYYNYEDVDSIGEHEKVQDEGDQALSRIEWFDLRSRRKRHAPQAETKENTVLYTVCARKTGNSTGMAVVDISLLSGLQPNLKQLGELISGTEKYIDHYDLGPNKVYLYFNKLTENEDCVGFEAKQVTPIGLVQPARAVIYDYYNPDRRCSIFYSPPTKSTMISRLCKDDVCACAEGSCPKMKVTYSKNMERSTRISYACFAPIVDYVYVVNVNKSKDDGVFQYHTVIIDSVLQSGKDDLILNGNMREMIHRKSCDNFKMKDNAKYLVMGKDGTISDVQDASGNYHYVLSHDMWIEEIPEESRCKATKNRKACQLLQDFLLQYELNQCRD
nr:complement C4-A-like isoform X2 [Paramormyrops kingsleyae]